MGEGAEMSKQEGEEKVGRRGENREEGVSREKRKYEGQEEGVKGGKEGGVWRKDMEVRKGYEVGQAYGDWREE